MLVRAGNPVATTTTALTAVGLLSTATLFVLPLLALPAILFGLAVSSELLRGELPRSSPSCLNGIICNVVK